MRWRKHAKGPERRWTVAVAEVGAITAFLRFDRHFSEPIPGFGIEVALTFTSHEVDENGFVRSAEWDVLDSLSSSFSASSNGAAILVGRINGGGCLHYLFYARDTAWIERWKTSRKIRDQPHRFSVSVNDDPEWSMYKAFLPHVERGAGDLQTFQTLMQAEAAFDQPRQFDWFFYFPSETAAASAQGALVETDFEVTEQQVIAGRYKLVASSQGPLNLSYIAHMSASAASVASEHGGTYDGWGSPI